MQQNLMQMQSVMAAFDPSTVTTDIIQQYLDENKSLILRILDNQNSGKLSECAENQLRLQKNLMYLAAIADSQPQPPPMHAQLPPNAVMQPGSRYLQHPQAQQMTPQSAIAAQSPMLYAQQPLSTIQQQHQALHGQIGMSPGANSGLHMLHGEAGAGSSTMAARGLSHFSRNTGESFQATSQGMISANRQGPVGIGFTSERAGNPGGQTGDGTEPLYSKGPGGEAN